MAGSLPTVRGGAQALYPITRRVEFMTDIAIAMNATEQRAKKRPPLTRFILPYARINATDMQAMRAFHASQKGTFDSTWTFTLGSTTYGGLTFEDDIFQALEEDATRTSYSFTLRARQTRNPGVTTGSPGGTFPALANGAHCEFPYTQIRRFAVLLNDNPIGPRYSWTWYAGSLSGFPTGALWGWTLGFPLVTDADLATLETFFRAQWGSWGTFTFTDPDDTSSHPKCRFASDVMEITHRDINQNSVTLAIQETN